MIRRWLVGLALVFLGLGALGAWQGEPLRRFEFREPHMGTTFRIVLYASDEATAAKAAKAAFARVAELNKIMSDYLPDSELMRLCKKSGDESVAVSEDLFRILNEAEKVAVQTDGAFDVTVGPLVRLWRRARRTRTLPRPDELKRALACVDYRKVRLSANGRTVRLLLMGMLLDLGGIAKGYAADAALAVLRRHGITRALVAAGGDIAVGAAPPGTTGWEVGIAPLKEPGAAPTHRLLLTNAAVSTSGDLYQAVEIAGKRYSHIVDPKTGLGLVGRRSVTVIAPNATTTDALATALCVMDRTRGLKLVEGRADVAALFVYETAAGVETIASKRFAKYVAPAKSEIKQRP